jgi:hypothetical protein
MSVIAWLNENLWEGEYFAPRILGPERVLFTSRCDWPLLANVIDGVPRQDPWSLVLGSTSLTESFFIRLRPLVSRFPAWWVYITNPDNSLSVIHWEREIQARYFNPSVLEAFEVERAVEGGVSRLVLSFADRQGVIVFELDSELRIVFHGSPVRLQAIRDHLHK